MSYFRINAKKICVSIRMCLGGKEIVSEFHYKLHKYLLLKLNNTYGSEFALAQFKTEDMKELIL